MLFTEWLQDFPLRDAMGEPTPLVWHEAGHALMAYRHGLSVRHVDLTGLYAACPNVGVDDEVASDLGYWERLDHFCRLGMAAVAGPVAESLRTGRLLWRTDGDVALSMAGRVDGNHPGNEWLRQRRRQS